MNPRERVNRFGDQITFRDGGVDTQQVCTPDEVRSPVWEQMEAFGSIG